MHADMILNDKDADKALAYAQLWLQIIGEEQAIVSQENSVFYYSVDIKSQPFLKRANLFRITYCWFDIESNCYLWLICAGKFH